MWFKGAAHTPAISESGAAVKEFARKLKVRASPMGLGGAQRVAHILTA